ncbi:hypothetical protein UFOVP238_44 [uncultured Caudovirales phage]|uniref:Uncharacterized protein n=1 Tax=uncultured Caudovirales phage TaxID=2100421 RepID=A0A6J7WQW2_9CAUD|nr:hypothetical protein UFOVP238_44 [uncultured Caudovirales phage]
MIVGEAVVRYTADATGLIQGTNQATASLKALQLASNQGASSLKRMGEVAAGIGIYQVLTHATSAVVNFTKAAVESAARTEEMNFALSVIGRNAGETSGGIEKQRIAIQKLGIETSVAQQTLAEFMRNGLQSADAAKVARVAQDAAVVSATNSSESLQNILYGIVTRQTEVIRNAGVTVSLESAFQQAAASKNKTTDALTENEKTQAAVNAVIREGATLEGTYEAAMESASKQLRSRVRLVSDLKDSVGSMGTPLFTSWVFGVNDMIKMTTQVFDPSGPINKSVTSLTTVLGVRMTTMWQSIRTSFDAFVSGGGLESIGQKLTETFRSYSGTGGALAGGMAGLLTSAGGGILGQLGKTSIGSFIPELAGFALPPGLSQAVSLFTSLIVSSHDFRDALVNLGKSIITVAGQIVQAFNPVTKAFQNIVDQIAPAASQIVNSLAKIIPQIGEVAASFISATAPLISMAGAVIVPLVNALATVVGWLEKSKIAVIAFGVAMSLWVGAKIVSQVMMLASAYRELAAGIALARTAESAGGVKTAIGIGIQRAATAMGGGTGFVSKFGGMLAGGSGAAVAGEGAGVAAAGAGAAIGAVAVPVLAVAAAVGVGVLAWKIYSDGVERARKANLEMTKQAIDSQAVYRDGQRDLLQQVQTYYAVQKAARAASDAAYARIIAEREAKGVNNDRVTLTTPETLANQQIIADSEAVLAGMKDYYKSMLQDEKDYSAKSVATANERLSKLRDSSKLLAQQLAVPPEMFSQLENMIPAQAKIITDQLNQMVEYTKSWRMEMQSGASALKEAWSIAQSNSKITGAPSSVSTSLLQGVFTNRSAQVSMFNSDIDQLINLAGDKSAALITELEKAGPQQVGDALHSWIQNLSTMTQQDAKGAVDSIVTASSDIAKGADTALRSAAVKLSQGQVMDLNNPDVAKQFVSDYQSMQQDLNANQSSLVNASMSGIFKDNTPIAQASGKLNELITKGASTDAVKEQAQYLNILAKSSSNLSGDQGTLAKTLVDSTQAIMSQYGAFKNATDQYTSLTHATEAQREAVTEATTGQAQIRSAIEMVGKTSDKTRGALTSSATTARNGLKGMVSSLNDPEIQSAYDKFVASNYNVGSEAAQALIKAFSSKSSALGAAIQSALSGSEVISNSGTVYLSDQIRDMNNAMTSQQKILQDNKNAIAAERHEYDSLKQSVDNVVSRQLSLISTNSGVGNSSQRLAEALGNGITQGKELSQVHRDVADATSSAMESIKAHVMAMAEARLIGRDFNSVQTEMNNEIDSFKQTLAADTAEWLRNNQAKIAAQSVAEELAKTSGIMNTAIKATDAVFNTSTDLSVKLAQAIFTIPKNAREAANAQIGLRTAVTSYTDSVEQQAYALAAQGKIGKDTQSIYAYIVQTVNAMITSLNNQTAAVMTADEAIQSYNTTWDNIVGKTQGVIKSQFAVDDALRTLTQTYNNYAGVASSDQVNLDAQKYAHQQLAQSVDQTVIALRNQAEALVTSGKLANNPKAINAWMVQQLTALKSGRPAIASIVDGWISDLNRVPPAIDTQARIDTNTAVTQLQNYVNLVNSVPPDKNTNMNVLLGESMTIIDNFKKTLTNIPDETVYINAEYNADLAIASLNDQFRATIEKVQQFSSALEFMQTGGKYVSQEIGDNYAKYGGSLPSNVRVAPDWLPKEAYAKWDAISGVFRANGGVEDHTAQIAPAGSWRVFAEPETGGEAYIPLALSKRTRSLQLLRQVSNIFGGDFVQYADGNVGYATWNTGGFASNAMSNMAGNFFLGSAVGLYKSLKNQGHADGAVYNPYYTQSYQGRSARQTISSNSENAYDDVQVQSSTTTIEQLHVHTNLPPQEWIDEAQWRRTRRSGL